MHRNLGVFTTRNVSLSRLFSQFQGKSNGFQEEIDPFILDQKNIILLV